MTFKEEWDEGGLSTTGTEYLQVLKKHVHCLNYKIEISWDDIWYLQLKGVLLTLESYQNRMI